MYKTRGRKLHNIFNLICSNVNDYLLFLRVTTKNYEYNRNIIMCMFSVCLYNVNVFNYIMASNYEK